MNLKAPWVIKYMSETNVTFTQALNILDNISKESFLTDVWIPSLKQFIKVKEINAKQQKSIIESAIDSTVSKSNFSKILFDVKVASVRTMTRKNKKLAYVKLTKDFVAADLATKLGVL